MNLTKEKLIAFWNKREEIFEKSENKDLVERFDKINELFDKFQTITVEVDENQNKVVVQGAGDENNKLEIKDIDCSYFGITKDRRDFCRDRTKGQEPVSLMAKNLPNTQLNWRNLIQDIGCLLSGYVFSSDILDKYKMTEEFRILSNKKIAYDDNGSLLSGGQFQAASSQLSGNNYFFWVLKTIADIKADAFDPQDSHLVLSYPKSGVLEKEQNQKAMLEKRFPYKFFYMWTHKDMVIHPFSLKAYKNFITQKDAFLRYEADQAMNQKYNDFAVNWKAYSDGIVNIITERDPSASSNRAATVAELSKLISIIMARETDIKNIRDLVETGNKAIILWGPPGTGKTYQATALVREMLSIPERETEEENEQELENYRFSIPKSSDLSEKKTKDGNEREETNGEEAQDEKKGEGAHEDAEKGNKQELSGLYDIVQFHPNYTYEDFVGGISPELNGRSLGYTLKTGRFKAFCDEAAKLENSKKKFIFIIDEINRADLSAVFGELLYALEYRGRSISIPNFDKTFTIPPNVYIVGTMNNVDKSLVSFDLALRRRFGFFKVMPNMKVLENLSKYINEETLSAYIERCEKLNASISDKNSLGLGDDYQIGHAYFLKIKDFLPKESPEEPKFDKPVESPVPSTEELKSAEPKETSVPPTDKSESDEPEEDSVLPNLTTFELEKLWVYHIEPLLEEYLGNKLDDDDTKKKIIGLRNAFTEEFKA